MAKTYSDKPQIDTSADEIGDAGPGRWAVRFNDNSPVMVIVPVGSNLRQVIDQTWPGLSDSAVAISASQAGCWYCDGPVNADGSCPACNPEAMSAGDWGL